MSHSVYLVCSRSLDLGKVAVDMHRRHIGEDGRDVVSLFFVVRYEFCVLLGPLFLVLSRCNT